MGLFAQLATYIVAKSQAAPGSWNISQFQDKRPYLPSFSHKDLVDRYSGWVYACANKNAINCAQVPLRLYAAKPNTKTKALFPTKTLEHGTVAYLSKSPTVAKYLAKAVEVEEVLDHPFLTLMQQVNGYMNQFDLLELMFLSQELTGNAYWYLFREGEIGLPTEIWPLMAQFIKIVPSKETFIEYYEYMVAGGIEKRRFEPENVVHFKYVSPRDAYYGLGPLQAAVVAADLSKSMNTFEVGLFLNRAQPDVALILPPEAGEPSTDAKKGMYKEWYKRFGGVKKGGGMAILHGGADLKQISLSPKDMAYLKGRKATLNEIAAIFGVPMSKLTTDNVNRSNAEAGDYSYMKDTILPRLRKVEQKLNEQLLPIYDERLFVAFDNPVPEDREYRLKEVELLLKTGYSSINEQRQIDGLEPVEWGNVPLMSMTIAPLGSVALIEPLPVPPKHIESIVHKALPLPPFEQPTNFVNQSFVRDLQKFYRKQEKEILAAFDRDADELEKGAVNSERYHLKADAGDFTSSWFDAQKWSKELSEVEEPFIRYTMFSGGEKALRKLRDDLTFDPINPKVMNALEKHRFGSITGITDTMAKKIRKSLAEGMAANESKVELRKRIQAIYGDAIKYNAERIARTETIWAWNEGAVQGYIQSGIVTRKKWVSTGDDRTCEFCPEMDGRTISVEGSYFEKGGEGLIGNLGGLINFYYEDVEHPPLHVHCRCGVMAVVETI